MSITKKGVYWWLQGIWPIATNYSWTPNEYYCGFQSRNGTIKRRDINLNCMWWGSLEGNAACLLVLKWYVTEWVIRYSVMYPYEVFLPCGWPILWHGIVWDLLKSPHDAWLHVCYIKIIMWPQAHLTVNRYTSVALTCEGYKCFLIETHKWHCLIWGKI